MTTFFLNPEVRWHAWADGVVLFSPRSAETVMLPGAAEALLLDAASAEGWSAAAVGGEAESALVDALLRLAALRGRD